MSIKVNQDWLNIETGKYVCPYCGKEYSKNGISTHIWRMHTEEGKSFNPNKGYELGTRFAWSKGQTKETNPILANISKNLKKHIEKHGHNWQGRKHSEKTKKLLSIKQTEYLRNNPDKHPYKMYHYTNGISPAEKYFKRWLDFAQIDYEMQVPVSIYILDFVIWNKKLNIEIDGEQHYNDIRISKSDKRRTKFLEECGWRVIRIRWSEWQRKTKEEKKDILNYIKDL